MAAATDADWVTRLVLGWLAAKRSQHTRAAYARDIGITPQRRTSRAASWLAWCDAEGVHPVTGVTGFHVTQYARQLDAAGLSPASAARKLAAVSGWYAWLVQRGHITASPAAGVERPKSASGTPATPALTRDQALALLHAADAAHGPQRARAAALVAVLLFTGARVCEVIGANVEDFGSDHGRRVLWVTRPDSRRQGLELPGPAASRIETYLAGRAWPTAARGKSGNGSGQALFATRTGRRLFAADVGQFLRRLATQAALPGRPFRPSRTARDAAHVRGAIPRGRRIAARPSGRHGAFRRPHHPALRAGRAHSPSSTRPRDRCIPGSSGLAARRRPGR